MKTIFQSKQKKSDLTSISFKKSCPKKPEKVIAAAKTPSPLPKAIFSEGDEEEDLCLVEEENPPFSITFSPAFEKKILSCTSFSMLEALTSQKSFFDELPPNTVIVSDHLQDRFKFPAPYKHTIVKLSEIEQLKNTYINASWIKFPGCERSYIAMQAPFKKTASANWHLIYQYKVEHMVMLSTEISSKKVKKNKRGYRYWPENVGESQKYPPYTVTYLEKKNVELDEKNFLIIRKFQVTDNKGKDHFVNHYQIHWDDFGVIPAARLRKAISIIDKKMDDKKLLIVHCTAGVGRTGTYIAADYLTKFPEQNLYLVIAWMRLQRMMMVQTEEQAKLIEETIQLGIDKAEGLS